MSEQQPNHKFVTCGKPPQITDEEWAAFHKVMKAIIGPMMKASPKKGEVLVTCIIDESTFPFGQN